MGLSFIATANAQITAKIVRLRAPSLTSPDRPGYRPNGMTTVETGVAAGVGFTGAIPVPANYIFDPLEIIAFQNPKPRLEFGLYVSSTTPISLASIYYEVDSSDVTSSSPRGSVYFVGNLEGSYSTTRTGIRKDGTRLVSGPASALVDEIVYLGFGISYEATTETEASSIKRYILEKNLSIRIRYRWGGPTGTVIAESTLRFSPPIPAVADPKIPVIADFTASTTATPLTVQFTDRSTGPVSSWDWGFGDGTKGVGKNPTHTYTTSGNFTVTLVVSGNSLTSPPVASIISVAPVPPSNPVLELAVGITPAGSNVLTGTELLLEGFVQVKSGGVVTVTNLFFEFSMNGKNEWKKLSSAGTSVSIPTGSVGAMSPYKWKAGDADPNTVWDVRLVVTAGGVTFTSPPKSIRVIGGPVGPVSLSIRRQDGLMKVLLTAPAGKYGLEEAVSLQGPWSQLETLVVENGKLPERSFKTNGLIRFFRTVWMP